MFINLSFITPALVAAVYFNRHTNHKEHLRISTNCHLADLKLVKERFEICETWQNANELATILAEADNTKFKIIDKHLVMRGDDVVFDLKTLLNPATPEASSQYQNFQQTVQQVTAHR